MSYEIMEDELEIKEIRLKSSQDLRNTLVNLRKEFVNMVFQKKLGQCNNTVRFALVRKSMARILTVLNERESERRKKNNV